jgi:hypothetical protein
MLPQLIQRFRHFIIPARSGVTVLLFVLPIQMLMSFIYSFIYFMDLWKRAPSTFVMVLVARRAMM